VRNWRGENAGERRKGSVTEHSLTPYPTQYRSFRRRSLRRGRTGRSKKRRRCFYCLLVLMIRVTVAPTAYQPLHFCRRRANLIMIAIVCGRSPAFSAAASNSDLCGDDTAA